jgi:hypothetical protein
MGDTGFAITLIFSGLHRVNLTISSFVFSEMACT